MFKLDICCKGNEVFLYADRLIFTVYKGHFLLFFDYMIFPLSITRNWFIYCALGRFFFSSSLKQSFLFCTALNEKLLYQLCRMENCCRLSDKKFLLIIAMGTVRI